MEYYTIGTIQVRSASADYEAARSERARDAALRRVERRLALYSQDVNSDLRKA